MLLCIESLAERLTIWWLVYFRFRQSLRGFSLPVMCIYIYIYIFDIRTYIYIDRYRHVYVQLQSRALETSVVVGL